LEIKNGEISGGKRKKTNHAVKKGALITFPSFIGFILVSIRAYV
jgi:hypothetical protein